MLWADPQPCWIFWLITWPMLPQGLDTFVGTSITSLHSCQFSTNRLQDLGWREVQDLECLRTGTQPQPTCKGCTRKDMLWISPELVSSFQTVVVDHDHFADHSVLRAFFRVDGAFAQRYLWPMPKPVPWNTVPSLDQPLDFSTGSPTDQYKALWSAKEKQAKSHLADKWEFQMQGRGQRTQPLLRKGWAAPPRKGRTCDFQPAFHGHSVQHSRWLRQLRRLHNYHRWALTHHGTATGDQLLHGCMLWSSIIRASGFHGSFQEWWLSRRCIGLQDPGFVPAHPPTADVACQLCEAFLGEVRALERSLNAAKSAARVSAHKRNANLIYHDTKRPMPEPVTSLLVLKKAKVTELRPEDSAVLLTHQSFLMPRYRSLWTQSPPPSSMLLKTPCILMTCLKCR